MNAITQTFKTSVMGYDADQVNGYIEKLTAEYDSVTNQYNELLLRRTEAAVSSTVSMEAISEALVDARVKGAQVVSEAKAKADAMMNAVKNEAKKIVEDAQAEAKKIVGGAYMELQKIERDKKSVTDEIIEMMIKLRSLLPVNDSKKE